MVAQRKIWFFAGVAAALSGLAVLNLPAQDRGLSVVAKEVSGSTNFVIGKQYAVIIGIDRYSDWTPLKAAVKEAKSVRQVLSERYYFDEFIELYDQDATAGNIRRLFVDQLPKKIGVNDSLLVFYAGHGYLDSSQTGFWIPVDGSRDIYTQTGWIANNQLRNYIGQLKAARILVMADSCFSGDLLNTSRGAAPIVDSAYFKNALTRVSRQVLSSGASETVPDQSEFAQGLLNFLERNNEPVVDTLSMYDRIRLSVSKTLPLFGTLPGNENGGSYVLFLKPTEGATAATATPAPSTAPATSVAATKPATVAAATIPSGAKGRLELASLPADYSVTALPASGGQAIALGLATDLASGTWTVKARIKDDSEDTFSTTVTIKDGGSVQVSLPKLEYSKPKQLHDLQLQRVVATTALTGFQNDQGFQKVLGWISLGLGVVGAGLGVYGVIDGPAQFKAYKAATNPTIISDARAAAELDSNFTILGFSIGGPFLIAAPLLLAIDSPNVATTQKSIQDIDAKIQTLNQTK